MLSCFLVGYYAPSETEEYTEISAGGDADDLARLCAKWEEAAKLPEDAGVRHVVIRIGAFPRCFLIDTFQLGHKSHKTCTTRQ
jgi:NAD dependent epimerase/dehydratase family enzyme